MHARVRVWQRERLSAGFGLIERTYGGNHAVLRRCASLASRSLYHGQDMSNE